MDDVKDFLRGLPEQFQIRRHRLFHRAQPLFPDSTINFPQTDPARTQALQIGKNLAGDDPEFLALARKYENEYGQIGQIARSIRADSGDYSDLQARLNDFNAHPPVAPEPGKFAIFGDPKSNFPYELSTAIQDTAHLDKIMPLILQRPSPRPIPAYAASPRSSSIGAPGKNGGNGQDLGNQFYPVLVKLLDDPDQQVQYSAMGCLFYMSGQFRQRPRIGNYISGPSRSSSKTPNSICNNIAIGGKSIKVRSALQKTSRHGPIRRILKPNR